MECGDVEFVDNSASARTWRALLNLEEGKLKS